jgi:hypothetical protein
MQLTNDESGIFRKPVHERLIKLWESSGKQPEVLKILREIILSLKQHINSGPFDKKDLKMIIFQLRKSKYMDSYIATLMTKPTQIPTKKPNMEQRTNP